MSTNVATSRLKKEVQELRKMGMFQIELVDESLYHMRAVIQGPPDTGYARGLFRLDIRIGDRYPFLPPTVKFLTRIWHPNISSATGVICLDVLQKKWEVSLTIRSILISIQVLLQDPVPTDPQDAVVAKQFLTNPEEYKRTAAYWTAVFAMPNSPEERKKYGDYEVKLQRLKQVMGEGYSEPRLIAALSGNCWNIEKAQQALT